MIHELPKLPYSDDALEPFISKKTIEFHYGKHHQAYVNNLNNLIKGTPFENASLEEIIKKAEGPIFNNGAQVWNHTFYFFQFSKNGNKTPSGELANKINDQFGTFENFKNEFSKSAVNLFGSGWAWLSIDANGKLIISQESNAGNPLRSGLKPLLTCDVWEHAYYIDYQNRRADYVEAFWNLIDWNIISERLIK